MPKDMSKAVSKPMVRGVYSSKKNPMAQPARTKSEFGPGMNPDQQKANRLLQQAQRKDESQRGMGVM